MSDDRRQGGPPCPHPLAHCSPSCTCQCWRCQKCRAAGYDHADPARIPGITAAEVEQWARDHGMTHVAEFDKAGNNVTEDTDPELTGNPEPTEPDQGWDTAADSDAFVSTQQPLATFLMDRLDVEYPNSRTNRMMDALRAIVRDHLAVHEIVGDDAPCTCHLLRQLASVWADHEAYLPEWRLR